MITNNTEIWKDIKGYENIYQASTLGNIKSLDREIIKNNGIIQHRKEHIIMPQENQDGYLQCKLCRNGKYKTVKIHKIIAETFIPNPNNLPEINHKDLNRKNNSVSNLEWTNHQENVSYSAKMGRYKKPIGENNPNYKGTKLKNYYSEHPEEKTKLSRPGKQNGRATKIRLVIGTYTKDFDYIGECAQYIIDRKITSSSNVNSIRAQITLSIKNHKPYKGMTFLKI